MAAVICQGCGTEFSDWTGRCAKCGNTEVIKVNEDRMIDRLIKGKFKILRKLGQGGMGAVYLAEQPGIGQRVALKFLKSEFSNDTEIARRFLNEAKSYALVAHPNAVTLHDFGQDDEGNLYIAMEYCEGVDLKRVLQEQRRLPVADAIDLVLQVADVLANAHAKGVVHRDLKPENIMVRKGMRGLHVKVLDFGIARLMNAHTQLTMAGAIAGTPRYMSPEQVEGREIDHRADVYALGILLYETLTGIQPFDGMTIAEILQKQVRQPMPLLVEHAPDVEHPEIDAVLQRACAKNRDQRYPDMVAFAAELSRAMPTQAGKPSSLLSGLVLTPGNTTPSGLGTSPGTSGMAPPSHQAMNADTMNATLMRPGSDPAMVSTQIERARPPSRPLPSIADEAPPKLPAKSPLPMLAAAAVALVVLGGGLWFAMGPDTKPPVVVPVPVPEVPPVAEVKPPPELPDRAPPVEGALTEFDIARGRDTLGRGLTQFKVGTLDEAEVYFKDVPEKSPSGPEAKEMLKKISEIRTKLQAAKGFKAQGSCERAIPLFRQVLALNPNVGEANAGLKSCSDALPPDLMGP